MLFKLITKNLQSTYIAPLFDDRFMYRKRAEIKMETSAHWNDKVKVLCPIIALPSHSSVLTFLFRFLLSKSWIKCRLVALSWFLFSHSGQGHVSTKTFRRLAEGIGRHLERLQGRQERHRQRSRPWPLAARKEIVSLPMSPSATAKGLPASGKSDGQGFRTRSGSEDDGRSDPVEGGNDEET